MLPAWFTAVAIAGCGAGSLAPVDSALPQPRYPSAEVLAGSSDSDWRAVDPARTLVMEVAGDPAPEPVIIELAPAFAPRHVDNVRKLVQSGYFDGLAVTRVQDNYVVQWGDAEGKRKAEGIDTAPPQEFEVDSAGLPFTPLPDGDVYAPQVGWSDGFAVGRDPARGKAWLAHCYGAVGVGRDNLPDPGLGTELYAVSGHAPRHLDRNLAMVGRVVAGMATLTALPRGRGPLGFYELPEQRRPLLRIRLAADIPAEQRPALDVLRTDTATFAAFVASRRFRREGWFATATGRVELCNVAVPVRSRPVAKE